ncbi:MAG TPA: LPS export ABC transporter permease LptF [Burkholderiaceae bacterium]|nr:LPS export ABC transporter permease LptF [Burkholderiaceae bacterium]
MLFTRALRRDLINLAGAVFATLFTIMVTTTLIRILGRAASNRVATSDVLPLIAFASINYIPILLVLTVYVSVLMSLSRAYRDSEMVVWFSSGQGLTAWVRPVLGFAAPFAIVVAVVAFVVGPWANRQSAEYRQRFEQREDVSQVAAGQFRESSGANRVFFVESISEDQTVVRNVFVTQVREGNLTVVASSGGRIVVEPDGARFLVLEDGRRWDGPWGGSEYRLMEFERYGVRLQSKAAGATDASTRLKTTVELVEDPTPANLAELVWRIGLPLSCIAVALLAIPLAFVNPRAGQSINLVVAVLIYVVYNNVTGIMQAWVAQERVPFAFGVAVTHVSVLALAAWLFWRRTSMRRLLPAWRRRVRPAAAGGR